MTIPYVFHPRLIVRTPCRPFEPRLDSFDLEELCRDKVFLEAIFLASPVLHSELIKYREGHIRDERAIHDLRCSVGKYYLRMSSRCTPFGLFSGCGVASWSGSPTSLVINDSHDRHTRPDMHYLCALAQHLAGLPFLKEKLRYYPNSSWYRIGEELRYVEYKYVEGQRNHLITSVEYSDYLGGLLETAKDGATWPQLVAHLTTQAIEDQEAQEYVSGLIDAQVLVHELEPAITGDEFLPQLLTVLERINTEPAIDAAPDTKPAIEAICGLLRHLHQKIAALDTAGVNEVAVYQEIKAIISRIGLPFDESKLFQADVALRFTDHRINESLQADLLEALDVLNILNKSPESPNLQSFIRRFLERYDQREMPLLEVLDTETGIGYLEQFAGHIVPLIDDVPSPARGGDNTITWSKRESFLLARLTETLAYGAPSIELARETMYGLQNDWEQLPPSISVLFRPLADGRLLLETSGGSSAVNLLGRFVHGNPAIGELVREVVAAEDDLNPDVIFAEIVHLPESRAGNVLLHPAFRRHEIPFLAKPSVDNAGRIPLQDLLISVRGDRIVLRSKQLDKVIIPRLSNAHNWTNKALPVYQFLCDLQSHGRQFAILFRWGFLEYQCRFLPRVTCRQVVISPAQWNFDKRDFVHLKEKKGAEFRLALADFRRQWKLPAQVILADGDNELYLNFEDDRMVDIWWDAVRGRPGFVLKEFLAPGGDHAVKDAAGRPYASQIMAVLLRTTTAYRSSLPAPATPETQVQSDFSTGSQWLYLKLYCGQRTADKLLTEIVHPLVTTWLANNTIDRFFFLRYTDPAFHIRLRVHLTDTALLSQVLANFAEAIGPYEADGRLWKVATDTYKRELERYGRTGIGLAEEFFFHDSLAVLEMLRLSADMDRDGLRWLWALRSIDEFLDGLGWDLLQKQTLAQYLKEAFHKEFNADKALRSQLSGKYRNHKTAVESVLNRQVDGQEPWRDLLPPLQKRRAGLQPITEKLRQLEASGQLEVPLHELLYSYVHMLVNRVVPSDPRKHELVLYDLLFAYYRSLTERAKHQEKNNKKITSAA